MLVEHRQVFTTVEEGLLEVLKTLTSCPLLLQRGENTKRKLIRH